MKGLRKFFATTVGGIVASMILILGLITALVASVAIIETSPDNTLVYDGSEINFEETYDAWLREDKFIITTDTYIVVDDFVAEFALSEFTPIEYVITVNGEFIDMEEELILNKNKVYEIVIISAYDNQLSAEYKSIDFFELETDMDLYIKWFVESE